MSVPPPACASALLTFTAASASSRRCASAEATALAALPASFCRQRFMLPE